VRHLRFPSRNLTDVVDWAVLANPSSLFTVELSRNALYDGLKCEFWHVSSLRTVDVSSNCLGSVLRFNHLDTRLVSLNVSRNRFATIDGVAVLEGLDNLCVSQNVIGEVPLWLWTLTWVRWLDLSDNSMSGRFPRTCHLLRSCVLGYLVQQLI
jgi:hypothetical protein